eukprot:Hpha_TRINITY_DN11760_c0_g1::TRINITY_DN11760_c0_g1_i1::g.31694::m.31694
MQYVTGLVSSATGAVTGAASYMVYGTDESHEYQVPCGRLQNVPVDPKEAAALANGAFYNSFKEVMDDAKWSLLQWEDPEKAKGGDLKLWSKPQDWAFHFIKATFCMQGAKAEDVVALVAAEQLETRQRFSRDIKELTYLERYPDGSSLARVTYYVPPPVAHRQMIFLQGQKKHEDGTIEVWGCSVNDERHPEGGAFAELVRARCFWGWRVRPVGDDACMVSYFSSSDPAGGVPNFFFRYAKTAVSSELINLRHVLKGEAVDNSLAEAETAKIMAEYKEDHKEESK